MSRSTYIDFEATYVDGSTERFSIDSDTLRSGDHVAGMIARDRQREGELPPGKIESVKRV